jgi:hypothetical protein
VLFLLFPPDFECSFLCLAACSLEFSELLFTTCSLETPPTFYDSISSFPVPRRLFPIRQLAAVPDLFSGVPVVVQLRLAGVDGLHEAGALASKDKTRNENGSRGVRSASIEGQDGSVWDLDSTPNESDLF